MDIDAARWLSAISECLIALVFVTSTVTKLRDASGFVASAARLVPTRVARWSPPIAGVVGALEALVPVLLLTRFTVRVGLGLAAALLIAFTIAIVVALTQGATVRCHCFGTTGLPLGRRHVVRNVALLMVVVLGGTAAPDGVLSLSTAELTLAGAASLPGVVALAAFDHIVDLFTPSGPARVKES